MDKLVIKDLRAYAYHGVYERETKTGQNFLINATIYCDFKEAAKDDEVLKAVDYGKVCHFLHAYFTSRTFKLLETAVEKMSKETLYRFPGIRKIVIEVKKPEAPIGLPFDYVSATKEAKWHKVYLSVGSNLGDKNENIEKGIEELNEREDCRVLEVSSIFKSKPYGKLDQDDFLNGALAIETVLEPDELLKVLKEIEAKAGKGHTIRWGPRTLDLDIVFYDQLVYDTKELQIPHIDMENRDFVLVPMSELGDYIRHPVTGLTIRQMLENLKLKSPGYILE
ncbi:MAG TPA: 2-amino-4-hydroxy-6-hydroxymethyldihydropteridine diphosphokinase [Candidatus Dorea intestinavium]|nr:2-amino-4-hydroxy-6-hydroxymethyldihydropteridine diphosphokinase [Candidatus Dorea intestinavium]